MVPRHRRTDNPEPTVNPLLRRLVLWYRRKIGGLPEAHGNSPKPGHRRLARLIAGSVVFEDKG
jgi:hypothetical protein